MTVETNTVVPLCPQISASTEADNGWMKRMEMEKSSRTERKTRTRSDGSRILTCRWDGVLWRLVRSEEWCRKCMWVEISCSMGLTRFLRSCFLSPSAPRAGILPLPPPRWVPHLVPLSNCTRTPASSQLFLALLSITLYRFLVIACDLFIRMFIHYTLNSLSDRPNPCPQLGDHDG